MSASSVIEITDLTKFYGDVKGIESLSFSVPNGEIFGFLGPNGAGKSTTIRLLLGLIYPTSGTATLFGDDIADRSALHDAKTNIGYIPDDGKFYQTIAGDRLLDYFAELKGDDRRDELLERFPIPEHRPVRDYSSGNKQKLAIIQAFMHDPDLYVMDEPTSGLDPLLQNEFYELLEEERASGKTCFFSSHILSEVRRVCDRVAIIRDGTLVALEQIDTLLEKSGKVVTVTLDESPPVQDLEFPGAAEISPLGEDRYQLIVTENYDGLIDTLNNYSITDLSVRETSLEDVFLHFYDETIDEPIENAVAEESSDSEDTTGFEYA